jgi:hypothetical protein
MAVHREVQHRGVVLEHALRAVAVVHVPVHDEHAARPKLRPRLQTRSVRACTHSCVRACRPRMQREY